MRPAERLAAGGLATSDTALIAAAQVVDGLLLPEPPIISS